MSEYKPVTVEAAKRIAEEFSKNIVIIACWDEQHQLLHTTTYGTDALAKVQAANGGEIVALALGTDMHKKQDYEDFRKDVDAGKLRVMEEKIQKAIKYLDPLAHQAISNVLSIRAALKVLR